MAEAIPTPRGVGREDDRALRRLDLFLHGARHARRPRSRRRLGARGLSSTSMCGICGVVDLSGAPIDADGVRRMLDALTHRGPDSWGLIEAPGTTAGIRRLGSSTLRPAINRSGTKTAAWRSSSTARSTTTPRIRLKLEAKGHRFKTRSDTEVLVHLWEEHGPEMVHDLDGMFAFCIVDRARRETFIARDALGIKPLYLRRIDAPDRVRVRDGGAASVSRRRAPRSIPHDSSTSWRCSTFPATGRCSGRS